MVNFLCVGIGTKETAVCSGTNVKPLGVLMLRETSTVISGLTARFMKRCSFWNE